MRSTLLRPESATFDFILRLDLAGAVGSRGAGVGAGVGTGAGAGAGVSVPVESVTGLEVMTGGDLSPSLSSLLLSELDVLFLRELLAAGPGLAVLSLAWLPLAPLTLGLLGTGLKFFLSGGPANSKGFTTASGELCHRKSKSLGTKIISWNNLINCDSIV